MKLLLENAVFLVFSTIFLVIVGWAWRRLEPFEIPLPLPEWFKVWFLTVQVVGGALPLIVMLLWGVWWRHFNVLAIIMSYFIILVLQLLFEIATLRWFHSIVWVMVPYLYLPYRVWQLYEGLTSISNESELMWVRIVLIIEIILWTLNYGLDLSQLPRLFRWPLEESSQILDESTRTSNIP